jgi:phenylacetate-CoA ligase
VAIEDVVRSIPELGNEYEVIVTKKGYLDDIALKVELKPGFDQEQEAVEARLADQLRLKTNLRYHLEFHPYGSLPHYAVKARRFRDLRK